MTKAFHLDANKEPSVIMVQTSAQDALIPERIALHITEEGIIMDFYSNHVLTGSLCRTYEEWFELAQ